MADQTPSLFQYGSPEAFLRARQQAQQAEADAYAQKSLQQRTDASGYMAGATLRPLVNSLFGVEDKGLQQVQQFQEIMKGVDRQDPDALFAAAKKLQDINHPAFDAVVAAGTDAVELKKKQAEASKAKLSLEQEQKLRDELRALGPDATEDQYLSVVRKYGKPDEIMKSIDLRQQRQAALEEKQRAAEAALANKLELARMQGATQLQIAQMNIDGKREIAQLMAETRRAIAEANKEKPLTQAQQLKLQRDTANSRKGLRDMDNTLQNTVDLAEEIKTHPGFSSAQGISTLLPSMPGGNTAKAESLIEEFKSGVKKAGLDLARQGGSIGSMTEKEWPIVESMVASINPRAGNVKEQMDKVISKINQIRANAYATHNEAFSENNSPTEILPRKKTAIYKSPQEWNAAWSSLQKGQSMVGLDGKTYTKN